MRVERYNTKNLYVWDRETALYEMLSEQKFDFLCIDKLYKRENALNNLFDTTVAIGEDRQFVFENIAKCNKLVFEDICCYTYERRDGSAMDKIFSEKNVVNYNVAKNMCEYDRIFLVDSLSATAIVDIMVDHAIKLRDEGKTAEEIVSELEELRARTTIYIGLDTLEYLYKGGRLNRATATLGEIANLKPSITVSRDGKVTMYKKSIGKNKAIATIVKSVEDNAPDPAFPIYTVYTANTANSEKLASKLETAGYKVNGTKHLGCTIGAHLGPNIYGIVYIATNPQSL
jgi:hypothetical protein